MLEAATTQKSCAHTRKTRRHQPCRRQRHARGAISRIVLAAGFQKTRLHAYKRAVALQAHAGGGRGCIEGHVRSPRTYRPPRTTRRTCTLYKLACRRARGRRGRKGMKCDRCSHPAVLQRLRGTCSAFFIFSRSASRAWLVLSTLLDWCPGKRDTFERKLGCPRSGSRTHVEDGVYLKP